MEYDRNQILIIISKNEKNYQLLLTPNSAVKFLPQEDRLITTKLCLFDYAADARAFRVIGRYAGQCHFYSDAFSQQWNPAKICLCQKGKWKSDLVIPLLESIITDIALLSAKFHSKTMKEVPLRFGIRYFTLGEN